MTAFPFPPPAEAIRMARENAGLTQEDAAALIYKKRRTWADWEARKALMDPALWELWQIKLRRLKASRAKDRRRKENRPAT